MLRKGLGFSTILYSMMHYALTCQPTFPLNVAKLSAWRKNEILLLSFLFFLIHVIIKKNSNISIGKFCYIICELTASSNMQTCKKKQHCDMSSSYTGNATLYTLPLNWFYQNQFSVCDSVFLNIVTTRHV